MTIKFLEIDALTIYDNIMGQVTDSVQEPLYSGDERRIFSEAIAMVLMTAYNSINDAANQKMLQNARNEVLDALGERQGVERLPPEAAMDTFRFRLSDTLNENILIPKGTRITPDGEIFFATTKTATINSGELYTDVVAECTLTGEVYNDIEPGMINTLVDVIPYISEVENINGTSNGSDGEEYTEDGDERYRKRIKLANATFSVAGPKEAYEFFTLSADAGIIDANVATPSPCEIEIYPLMAGGQIPSTEILKKVETALSDNVRPLTDHITVLPPTKVLYDIEFKYYCTAENEEDAMRLVEGDGGAIDNYIDWQGGTLGRDISPDALRRLILMPDDRYVVVDRVDIVYPEYLPLRAHNIATWNGRSKVTHEVIEE